MPSPIPLAQAPLRDATSFVCAWCGEGIRRRRRSGANSINYGICEPCLEVRMEHLVELFADSAAGGTGSDRLRAPCSRELSAPST
jgi:hypothetical protein